MSSRIRIVAILPSLLCLTAISASAQESAEDELQSALYKQEVEGDLEGAIELFRAIADDYAGNRRVAARAWLQLGRAYETLGSREAERAYRTLVRDYPEQSETVDRARERLAILNPETATAPEGLIARRLWQTRAHSVGPGALSPDGREVAFVQWADYCCGNSGDLGVADVQTGTYRIVGRTSPQQESDTEDTYVEASAWSPDGSRIMYSDWATTWDHHVVHIVNPDGSGHRVVSDNLQNRGIRPRVWSSDGRWVLAVTNGWDDVWRIVTISVEDGSVTVLKTLRRGQPAVAGGTLSLSPDDRFVAYAYSPSALREPDIHVLAVDGSGERIVAPNAGTDLDPLWTPDGSRLVFLSDRSGSAALWAVQMSDGRNIGEPELIQPHFGTSRLLGFMADGSLSYATQVPESSLQIVSLDADGALGDGQPLSERFVGYNSQATWSPDGSRVAYLSRRPELGDRRDYVVVKALADGRERDIELPISISLGRTGPAWSADGRQLLLRATYVERTETGATTRLAGYTIDVESGEVQRAPYIWDYAGFWGTAQERSASGRQTARLRDLGIRFLSARAFERGTFAEDNEPLRPGEALLNVQGGWGWLRFTECDADEHPRPVESHPNAVWCIFGVAHKEIVVPIASISYALSPDGNWLASTSYDEDGWSVHILPVTLDGEPRLLKSHPHSEPGRCACVIRWTPDGRDLIYGLGDDIDDPLAQVHRIDVQSGKAETLNWEISRRQLGEMAFHPDGRRVILPIGAFTGRTELWTLSGFPWQEIDRGQD